MASNIEWKARVHDLRRQRELVEQFAGRPTDVLEQTDTFFPVAHGRLKLRRFSADHGELIHYFRADQAGPKQSTYAIVPISEPDALCAMLSKAIGVRGVVRKRRWLYLAGQARIHLDDVEELGTFLEVEVVLRPGQLAAEGEQLAESIRGHLDVRDVDLLALAYIDLMQEATSPAQTAPCSCS
jgi:adenylate cyclase class IV